jgi:thioesterase domain-containing protein
MLAVTRANDTALRAYQPPSGDTPVLLFCGTEGFAQQFGEPELGWRELVPCALEVVNLPGTHHTIMSGPGVAAIAERLAREE